MYHFFDRYQCTNFKFDFSFEGERVFLFLFSEKNRSGFLFGLNKEREKTCGTGQDELSDGCKCFQQLLLQWVEHIQSIAKQIKSSGQSEWEKLQWTGRQSHTQMNSQHWSCSVNSISEYTSKYLVCLTWWNHLPVKGEAHPMFLF